MPRSGIKLYDNMCYCVQLHAKSVKNYTKGYLGGLDIFFYKCIPCWGGRGLLKLEMQHDGDLE